MPEGKCKCGTPSEAAYSTEGAIGRGDRDTGTQTEEHSAFWCAEHGPDAETLIETALAARDKQDPVGFAHYGPWEILELKLHDLAAHDRERHDDDCDCDGCTGDEEYPPCPEECETLV